MSPAAVRGASDERLARAHLSRVVEPGDPLLTPELARHGADGLVDRLRRGRGPEHWRARQATLTSATPELLAVAASRGLRVVVPGDPAWPGGLDDLDACSLGTPPCLWVRGRLPDAVTAPPAVSVVGARSITAYGEHVAEELGAELVAAGWTVVSGAAYGVDGAAHRGALAAPSDTTPPTIAVLASGVDRASPAGHAVLLERLVDAGGAVVSELPPGSQPMPWRFLRRNRLIAAWGRGVVVVEAGHRSGALNTARVAVELGRHVAAVPGPVTSAMSVGTNGLLRDGAVCVTRAADVIELLAPLGVPSQPEIWSGPASSHLPDTGGGASPTADRPWDGVGRGEPERRVLQALAVSDGATTSGLVAATGLDRALVSSACRWLQRQGSVTGDGTGWRRGGQATPGAGVVP